MSLLLLTAIATLAVTLGEDFGPSDDPPSTVRNPGVNYANPVLFTVTWVNIAGFTFIYLLWSSRWKEYVLMCFFKCILTCYLLDTGAVVSRRSEADGRSGWLRHSLHLLVAPCSVRHLPFSDPPTRGTQAGMNIWPSWEQGINQEQKWYHHFSISLALKYLSHSHLWPSGRGQRCPSFLPILHFLWTGSDCTHSLCCGWYRTGSQRSCKKGTVAPI